MLYEVITVLKHAGFGRAVNITLGLPIVRTSVDHGTALDLAGTGRADGGSLQAAVQTAIEIARLRAAVNPPVPPQRRKEHREIKK